MWDAYNYVFTLFSIVVLAWSGLLYARKKLRLFIIAGISSTITFILQIQTILLKHNFPVLPEKFYPYNHEPNWCVPIVSILGCINMMIVSLVGSYYGWIFKKETSKNLRTMPKKTQAL